MVKNSQLLSKIVNDSQKRSITVKFFFNYSQKRSITVTYGQKRSKLKHLTVFRAPREGNGRTHQSMDEGRTHQSTDAKKLHGEGTYISKYI